MKVAGFSQSGDPPMSKIERGVSPSFLQILDWVFSRMWPVLMVLCIIAKPSSSSIGRPLVNYSLVKQMCHKLTKPIFNSYF